MFSKVKTTLLTRCLQTRVIVGYTKAAFIIYVRIDLVHVDLIQMEEARAWQTLYTILKASYSNSSAGLRLTVAIFATTTVSSLLRLQWRTNLREAT